MKKTGYQSLRCGLLGEHLGHSFSPQIHRELADYEYRLIELAPDELAGFLTGDGYDALNVTIPYKKAVIPYLDELSDEAQRIGAVNTIVRRDGKKYGYNTDYFGFDSLITHSQIPVAGKKILVLGTGGASLTVQAVLADRGAGEITVISRNGADNYGNLDRHTDAEVIVNATPVGMYPNNGVSPVSLRRFPRCEGVLDLIYNPARTALLLEAEELGIPAENGLYMLVAQAASACGFFTGSPVGGDAVEQITAGIALDTQNIILIGMPGCGKSTDFRSPLCRCGRGICPPLFGDPCRRHYRRGRGKVPANGAHGFVRAVEKKRIRNLLRRRCGDPGGKLRTSAPERCNPVFTAGAFPLIHRWSPVIQGAFGRGAVPGAHRRLPALCRP